MKVRQFSELKTVPKVLVVLFCLIIPVLAGCWMPAPYDDSHARLFDVALSLALAVFVWCGFRLIEPARYSLKWAIAELIIVPVVWFLLILVFAHWFNQMQWDGGEIIIRRAIL